MVDCRGTNLNIFVLDLILNFHFLWSTPSGGLLNHLCTTGFTMATHGRLWILSLLEANKAGDPTVIRDTHTK